MAPGSMKFAVKEKIFAINAFITNIYPVSLYCLQPKDVNPMRNKPAGPSTAGVFLTDYLS